LATVVPAVLGKPDVVLQRLAVKIFSCCDLPAMLRKDVCQALICQFDSGASGQQGIGVNLILEQGRFTLFRRRENETDVIRDALQAKPFYRRPMPRVACAPTQQKAT
jgi:hypothetical protein